MELELRTMFQEGVEKRQAEDCDKTNPEEDSQGKFQQPRVYTRTGQQSGSRSKPVTKFGSVALFTSQFNPSPD